MSQLDQLAGVIFDAAENYDLNDLISGIADARRIAGAVLAAGFQNSQLVEDYEALNELSAGTVVRDATGKIFERVVWNPDGFGWAQARSLNSVSGQNSVTLPASVLFLAVDSALKFA